MKTETVHTRVTPEIKLKADQIFEKIGLTTSQAIMLFLTATVNANGFPFTLNTSKKYQNDVKFAKSIVKVDGVEPSKKAEKLLSLYANGDIDYETAQFAIERMYKKL